MNDQFENSNMDDIYGCLKAEGETLLANENIYNIGITEKDFQLMELQVAAKFREIMKLLLIDVDEDPNTKGTPARVAKMYVREVFKGRYEQKPKLTVFPNTKNVDEIFTIGPISFRSACSHHFVPFIGQVWIGVIPGETLLGLSKFARLTHWVMTRPHIQEEAVQMLANEIEAEINPRGLAVVAKAQHLCMSWRGVQEDCAEMTSSVVRGLLANWEAKQEFFNLIKVN